MTKRLNADQMARVLGEADRDPAKGLMIAGICRKIGVAQTTYYPSRQRREPAQVNSDRRCREWETEFDRLKRSSAELLLDKPMLQNIAKELVSPTQQRAAADYLSEQFSASQWRICRALGRRHSRLRYHRRPRTSEPPLAREIKRLARRHPRCGYRWVHALLIRQG